MDYDAEPSLRDILALVQKGLLLALTVAIVAAVATYLVSRDITPTYRARATVIANRTSGTTGGNSAFITPPPLDPSVYRTAALTSPVLRNAVSILSSDYGVDSLNERSLARHLRVRVEEGRDTSTIFVEADSTSPDLAAQIANASSEALLTWDQGRASQRINQNIASLEEQLTGLDEQIVSLETTGSSAQLTALREQRVERDTDLRTLRALSNSAVGLMEVLEPAFPPLAPISPQPTRNAALAFALGLFVTYGLLILRNALDTRVRDVDDLAHVTGSPVMAEFARRTPATRRLSREASSYLRTNLLFAASNAQPKVILVTSAIGGEGKSSVALSLAESFARSEHRTLLVDADLRKPVSGREYNLNTTLHASLQKHLENPHQRFAPASVSVSLTHKLDIIPSFSPSPSPAELLSKEFRVFLETQRDDYDVVIVDSAPVLPVADTLTLAPWCTGVLLVVSLQDANRQRVRASMALLQRIGVRVLGVAATNVGNAKGGGERYGYGYGESDPSGSYAGSLRQPGRSVRVKKNV